MFKTAERQTTTCRESPSSTLEVILEHARKSPYDF